jgi:NitT/TauT family transport system substrate-binding protein
MLMRAALVVTFALAAVAASAQTRPSITIGLVRSVPSASTYLALDKGYFREAGVDVKIETVDSAAKIIPFIAQGQVQVAQGGISAAYFNAVGDGLPIRLALEGGSTPVYHSVVVRPELKGQFKKIADLKGRPVALVAPGSSQDYQMGKLLGTVGLTLKDIDVKYMAFPQMAAALANKGVDAALEDAPFLEQVVAKKLGVRWIDPEDVIQPVPTSLLGYIVNVDWAEKNQALAKKLMVALQRGARDYCQAYHHGPNRDEVVEVMFKHKVLTDRQLLEEMDWQARSPDGRFNVASLTDQQAFFVKNGSVHKETPVAKLVDTAYADEVAKALGPFKLINDKSPLKGCR